MMIRFTSLIKQAISETKAGAGGYWLASPNGKSYGNPYGIMYVNYYGYLRNDGYKDDDQSEGCVRPVVALKSGITGTYDETTGLWTLSK